MFDRDESHDPIASSHLKYIAAVISGDVETVVSLFHKDGILMPPNDRSIYGEAEMREWHQDYFQHFTIVSLQVTEREIRMLDDWAIERWTYTVAIEALVGSESIRDEGRFLKNWIREPDGVWRIAYAMFNSMQPVGSGTSRFLATIRKPQDSVS